MSRYLPDGCTHNPWNDCACGEPMCDASCEIEEEYDSGIDDSTEYEDDSDEEPEE
jgi:hypothetical protein